MVPTVFLGEIGNVNSDQVVSNFLIGLLRGNEKCTVAVDPASSKVSASIATWLSSGMTMAVLNLDQDLSDNLRLMKSITCLVTLLDVNIQLNLTQVNSAASVMENHFLIAMGSDTGPKRGAIELLRKPLLWINSAEV